MIKIDAMCIGKLADINDYVIIYTRTLEVMRMSDMLTRMKYFHIERTPEGGDTIYCMNNALLNYQTGEFKWTDGISNEKHWELKEIGQNIYQVTENADNPMVLGKLETLYVVLTSRKSSNPRIELEKSVGTLELHPSKMMLKYNEKLKCEKHRILNAKVVQSKKLDEKGKPIIYTQSFAGGIHALAEGDNSLTNIRDIVYIISNLGKFKGFVTSTPLATNVSEVKDYMVLAGECCSILKTYQSVITEGMLKSIGDMLLKGINAQYGKSVLSLEFIRDVHNILSTVAGSNKTDGRGAGRYETAESILQSIGKRCSQALEEAPKQTRVVMTGKSIQYYMKNNPVNGNNSTILMGILRVLDDRGNTKYLLSRIVRSSDTALEIQAYLTEDDRKTVLKSDSFKIDMDLNKMDSTRANAFCRRFKIRFSEIVVNTLREIHKI